MSLLLLKYVIPVTILPVTGKTVTVGTNENSILHHVVSSCAIASVFFTSDQHLDIQCLQTTFAPCLNKFMKVSGKRKGLI